MCIVIKQKKTQGKKSKNAYSKQNAFTKNPINIPVSRTKFFCLRNLMPAI